MVKFSLGNADIINSRYFGITKEVCLLNFFTVQSINAYTWNMEMQLKWQQKKEGRKKLSLLGMQRFSFLRGNGGGVGAGFAHCSNINSS